MELLGWRPHELLGRNKLSLRHPEDLAAGSDLLRPLLDGTLVTETDRILCADGTYRWMNRRYRAILDEHGRATYLIGSWRDAQAEVEASQALEASEREARELAARYAASRDEAEEANRAKSEFLSRMSHELRTPLNAMLGFAQLLELDDLDRATSTTAVDQILKGGRHLLDLINEVLDISRIEAGQLTLSLEASRSRRGVGDPGPGGGTRARAGRDRAGPDSVSHDHVSADRQRPNQVLLNLLSNAVKYNRPGGVVRIRSQDASAGESRSTWRTPGRASRPSSSRGCSSRSTGWARRPPPSRAPGRARAVRALARAMGGRIGVDSVVGAGSVFSLVLPEHPPGPRRAVDGVAPVRSARCAAGACCTSRTTPPTRG